MTALFFNALIYIYDVLGKNLGVAIIAFTIIIKFLLAWPSASSIRSQKKIQALQPKLQALKAKHKNDREGLAKATMELYRSSKVNPFSSCLPTLIQLPILIILYQVFMAGLKVDAATGLLGQKQLDMLYAPLRAVYEHTPIHTIFFPGLDLARHGIAAGSIIMALLAAGLQFWQTRMLTVKQPPHIPGAQDESLAATTSKQMMYMAPIMTVVIVPQLPLGLGLYWVVSTLFTIGQQWLMQRPRTPQLDVSQGPPPSSG